MKHSGAIMEYADERLCDIMRTFDDYIASCNHINMAYICKHIASIPARRFWVSDIWASKIVTAMLKGKYPYYKMRMLKKEMFQEICRRVVKLREQHPEWTINKCCKIIVAQPAPKHYLSSGSIRIMICKERKRRIRERQRKLQRLQFA